MSGYGIMIIFFLLILYPHFSDLRTLSAQRTDYKLSLHDVLIILYIMYLICTWTINFRFSYIQLVLFEPLDPEKGFSAMAAGT